MILKDYIKNKKILCAFFTFLATLCLFNLYNIPYIIALNLVISAYIIISAKYSILSIISILANYPIFPLMWQYYNGSGASSLSSGFGLGLYMSEMLLGILIFNIINLYFITFTKMIDEEQKLLDFKVLMNKYEKLIIAAIAIISLIISMPTIPFTHVSDFANVRKTLIVGNAWNYVMVCSVVMFFSSTKRIRPSEFLFFAFIMFWSLGNFNRAEVIGLFILVGLRFVKWNKIDKKKKIGILASALFIMMFMMFLGYYRVQQTSSSSHNIVTTFILDIKNQLINLTNQNTAGDIIHIYNTGFHYTKLNGFLNGKSYLMYVYSILPFYGSKYNNLLFTNILKSSFYNLGGGYFLTEPYINFGYVGIAAFSVLMLGLLRFITKKQSFSRFLYYGVFVSAIFRLQWYGLIFIERSFLAIIPVLIIFHYLIGKVDKQQNDNKSKVCIIGQFPPPIHGLSKALDTLYKSRLKGKYNFEKIDITNNKKALNNIFKLMFSSCNVFYLTIAQSKFGNIRDMFIITILKIRGKNVILHLHGGYYKVLFDKEMGKFQRKVNKKVLNSIDGAIVLGESLKYIFQGIVPEEKIYIVYNCVDNEFILEDEKFQHKLHNMENLNEINILYLSNFIESKGYKEVLELAKNFKKLNDNVKFYFAGNFFDENDKSYFYDYIDENQLNDMITYKGVVGGVEKNELLEHSQVFILPTRYPKEGQPISIIEAMGNGIAIISTDYSGIPDLVVDGENGYLIDYNNVEEMCNKIKTLMKNNNLLKEIAINNRKKVKDKFLEKHYISNLEKVFDEVIKNGRLE